MHVLSCPPPGLCVSYHFLCRLARCTDSGSASEGESRPCGRVLMSNTVNRQWPVSCPFELPGVSIWTVPRCLRDGPPHFTSPFLEPVPLTARVILMQHSESPLSEVPISLRWGQTRPERLQHCPDLPRHPLLGRPLASFTPLPVTTLGPFMELQRVGHD